MTGGQGDRERDTEIGARTDGQGHRDRDRVNRDGGTIGRHRERDRMTVTGTEGQLADIGKGPEEQ